MARSNFDIFTTIQKLPNGKYECSCDKGIWSIVADSEYGAREDGEKAFEEHLEDGFYD